MVIRFKAVALAPCNEQVMNLIRHGLDGTAVYNRL